jgi:hypothetical protein
MKFVRGKYIQLSVEEFESLEKITENGQLVGYQLNLVEPDLDQHKEEITQLISQGYSRPSICKQFKIGTNDLDKILSKWFGTKKITEAKGKIHIAQGQSQIQTTKV